LVLDSFMDLPEFALNDVTPIPDVDPKVADFELQTLLRVFCRDVPSRLFVPPRFYFRHVYPVFEWGFLVVNSCDHFCSDFFFKIVPDQLGALMFFRPVFSRISSLGQA